MRVRRPVSRVNSAPHPSILGMGGGGFSPPPLVPSRDAQRQRNGVFLKLDPTLTPQVVQSASTFSPSHFPQQLPAGLHTPPGGGGQMRFSQPGKAGMDLKKNQCKLLKKKKGKRAKVTQKLPF